MNCHDEKEENGFCALFDRSREYADFVEEVKRAAVSIDVQKTDVARMLRKLRRAYDALCAIDFFPNDASRHAASVWQEFVHVAESRLSPGEPKAIDSAIPRLDISRYQSRIWATRKNLWVDRIASAWLIRRFIDRSARFIWLDHPSNCPPDALGFDFDGAPFTHVGNRVTFEVLVASFGLDHDPALLRLGVLVHALDIGGWLVPEAPGFEAMLAGARQRTHSDDQLLAEVALMLDSFYAHFSTSPAQEKP
jgi:hypothetical protein